MNAFISTVQTKLNEVLFLPKLTNYATPLGVSVSVTEFQKGSTKTSEPVGMECTGKSIKRKEKS